MSRRYPRILAVALFALFAVPSTVHASIWDFIWTMSGPQMMGVVLHCEYDPQHREERDKEYDAVDCRFLDRLFFHTLKPRVYRSVWVSLDTGYYVSTARDSGPDAVNKYNWFENQMVAFEPMLEIRSFTNRVRNDNGTYTTGNLSFHHGLIGASYDVLFGKKFSAFDKIGYKFRPFGITYKKVNASFTVRWYPNGFTADEFGNAEPRLENVNRKSEVLYGATIGVLWGRTQPKRQ
jgi:hypothetical protein